MATIFHVALASDWEAAQRAGTYTVSTRGRTLAEEGFIHCSRGDQWPGVRDAFYGDVTEPLVLLRVETDRLDVPVVDEPGAPGSTETFPHVYGPLPVAAVVKAIPLGAPAERAAAGAPPPGGPRRAAADRPVAGESFSRVFYAEMLTNAALLLLVMAATVVGVVTGDAVGGDAAPLAGAVVGLVVGAAAARVVYVRRHRAAG
jgi:uncharacterized protein (DUF952 family)